MSVHSPRKKINVLTLASMKARGEKIVSLTAYDASFAQVLDAAGVDIILVGDSLGMVIQGEDSTIPVTLDDMIYHARAVASQSPSAMLMVDMPFMTYTSPKQALHSAMRLMQEGAAEMVKLEGGARQVDTVRKLTEHGVPVCAHIGLTPQAVHKLGGYRVQGRDEEQAQTMLGDALLLQDAGADAVLIECVPEPLAAELAGELVVPVIGIGASARCDGQVLVLQDILGITAGRVPKFAHNFLQGRASIQEAVAAYVAAVRDGSFPSDAHIFAR
ncbi:MAG: 3-methyl-2-oxobutanoate hydroxymethyltransferase [bacterium]